MPSLLDPDHDKHVALAEDDDEILGYVAWSTQAARRHGRVDLLAVTADRRRADIERALCEHAFEAMRRAGAEVVEIHTGGDDFHAPARAFYESLGMRGLTVAVYLRAL